MQRAPKRLRDDRTQANRAATNDGGHRLRSYGRATAQRVAQFRLTSAGVSPAGSLYKLLIHVLFALYGSRSLIKCERAGCKVDIATIAIVVLVLISYVGGSLASSEETQRQLPHRY